MFAPKPGDVDRKLADTFPDAREREDARRILDGYDPGDWSVSSDRVRLAALYLCQGSVSSLATWIGIAAIDFRDVIAPAEYVAYMALPLDASEADKRQAVDVDADRYLAWIGR